MTEELKEEKERKPNKFLGIIYHFSIFSVPAFDDVKSAARRKVGNGAEWYKKRLTVKADSYRPLAGFLSTQKYHQEHYGDMEYENFAKSLKVKKSDINTWMQLAKEAGASYVLLTSRHHDSYCLFPTKTTKFHSKLDIVQMFKESAEEHGLIFGLYYSWSEFDVGFTKKYIEEIVRPQISELIKYKPLIWWFDAGWNVKSEFAKSFVLEMCALIRKKIPGVIINDRLGETYKGQDDLGHADQRNFEDRALPAKMPKVPWEHINTIGYSWGRNKQQEEKDYKSVEDLVKLYKKVRKMGGKFLLNLGPDGKGKLDPFEVERLKGFGEAIADIDESKFKVVKKSSKKEESEEEKPKKKSSKKKEESNSTEEEKPKKKKNSKKKEETEEEKPKKKSNKKKESNSTEEEKSKKKSSKKGNSTEEKEDLFTLKLKELGFKIEDNASQTSGAVKRSKAKYVSFAQREAYKGDVYWRDVEWDRIYFADEEELDEYVSGMTCGGLYSGMYIFTIDGKDISSKYDIIRNITKANERVDDTTEEKFGMIRIGQKRSRGVSGDKDASMEGFKTIDVTSGSMNKLGKVLAKTLSPLLLGPYTDKDGLKANIFENYWQYGKLWPTANHIKKGTDCEPTKAWYEFRKTGYASTKGKRRPLPVKEYGYSTCAFYNNKSYGYLDSRKEIYVPVYKKLIEKLPIIKELRKLLESGQNVMIVDGDGPPKSKYPNGLELTQKNWDKMINNAKYPFGHGYVVAGLLSGLNLFEEKEESKKKSSKKKKEESGEEEEKSKKKSSKKKKEESGEEEEKSKKKSSKKKKEENGEEEEKSKKKEESGEEKEESKKKSSKKKKEESGEEEEKSKKEKNITSSEEKKDPANLRIYAFNPNGLRALVKNNNEKEGAKNHLETFIREQEPDIIFFPETKGNTKLEKEMEKAINSVFKKASKIKWTWYWNHSDVPGRFGNAVAVSERVQIEEIRYGFKKKDDEGRVLALKLKDVSLIKDKGVWVLGLYVPNASTELKRLNFKIEWMKKLRKFTDKLREDNSVIIIGDINIAPEDTDIANPAGNLRTPGFTQEEKDYFKVFLGEEYLDIFRERNPAPNKSKGNKGDYTYWNTQSGARSRNIGWRIDLCLTDRETYESKDVVQDATICSQYWGSDHCPVGMEVKPLPKVKIDNSSKKKSSKKEKSDSDGVKLKSSKKKKEKSDEVETKKSGKKQITIRKKVESSSDS
jgi:exodeoxyribonuclease-3